MVRIVVLLLTLAAPACASDAPPAPSQAAPAPAAPASESASGASAGADDVGLAPDAVLATFDGGQVTWSDLQPQVEQDLRKQRVDYLMQRHDTMSQALDQAVTQQLLDAEAKKEGVTVDDLLDTEITQKVPEPSDADVASFYRMVKSQLQGASLDQAKPLLVRELKRRAQMERFQAYVSDLKEKAHVQTDLPYPDLPRVDVPIADGDPSTGPADAPVTIVEFADYQCPYCKRAQPTLDKLMSNYEGKIRLVYKDYPLPMHSQAKPAAVAAHCAGEQGKYWEMHGALLGEESAPTGDVVERLGKKAGLDMDAFSTCRQSGKYDDTIARDTQQGNDAGVSATPSFFINGIFVAGAQPYEQFDALVKAELSKDRARSAVR